MANLVKQLYELQEVDLELNDKRGRIQAIEGQLVESDALIAARSDVARVEGQIADLRKTQKDEETESADLGAKIKTLEGRLYGGSIKNSKELASIQTEADRLKATQRTHDDKAIDIMEQLEGAQTELKASREKLGEVEQGWKADQSSLLQEKETLTALVAELDKQRSLLREGIPPEALAVYDSLVGPKQGRVVARVERGTCQGCRINLPMSDIQRARLGKELVRCSNCGRILFVG